jgi:glycosyltransferase involved in cell wall biosynthesis
MLRVINSKQLISIIVPIFNVEKYLDHCILSILNQTFKNLEIILVNDGSTDSCSVMCDQYAIYDSRIKVAHKINEGVSSARNVGLDIATGKYVTFVDSDDSVTEDYIEVLYNALKKTNSQISIGDFIKVKSEEFVIKRDTILNESFQIFSPREAVQKMYNNPLNIHFVTVCWNLYQIDLFKSLRFPFGKIHEDEYLSYKLFFSAKRIVYTPNKIYNYFTRRGSVTTSPFSLNRLDVLQALEERIIFLKNLSEFQLMNESLYFYFHNLCAHLRKVRKGFPNEKLIINDLKKKIRDSSKTIILSKQISIRIKISVIRQLIILIFLNPGYKSSSKSGPIESIS